MPDPASSILRGLSPAPAGATHVLQERKDAGTWTQVASTTAGSTALTGRTDGVYDYRVKATSAGWVDSGWRTSTAPLTVTLTGGTGTWDAATWDTATWGN